MGAAVRQSRGPAASRSRPAHAHRRDARVFASGVAISSAFPTHRIRRSCTVIMNTGRYSDQRVNGGGGRKIKWRSGSPSGIDRFWPGLNRASGRV